MKACPVCGAGAFDDASTCFGCLHRYGEAGAEARDEPRGQARCEIDAPRVSGSQVEGLRPERFAAPRVEAPRPAARIASDLTPTFEREGSGWVVRFELPGPAREGCEPLRDGGSGGGSGREPCDLLIRFQAAAANGSVRAADPGERRARGSHARALEAGDASQEGLMAASSVTPTVLPGVPREREREQVRVR